MRLLLDTHVLLWWVAGDRRLSKATAAIIADGGNEVAVSAATFWEISLEAASRGGSRTAHRVVVHGLRTGAFALSYSRVSRETIVSP